MTSLEKTYVKINRDQITNSTDYVNELLDQFSIDCSAEDIKEFPEAKQCFKQLRGLGRSIKIVNSIEKRIFGI